MPFSGDDDDDDELPFGGLVVVLMSFSSLAVVIDAILESFILIFLFCFDFVDVDAVDLLF